MSHRPTQKEKTSRAYRAYLDLLGTADWVGGETRGQLASFDLTMRTFRVLEMLRREGAMSLGVVAERCRCKYQNVDAIAVRMEERGWVRREVSELPPVEIKESHIAKVKRGEPRRGRSVVLMQLTPAGEKFMGNVFPRHAKVIKALMRTLDGREQETLSRLLRKLREGDVLKFFSEITHEDVEEDLGARDVGPAYAVNLLRRGR